MLWVTEGGVVQIAEVCVIGIEYQHAKTRNLGQKLCRLHRRGQEGDPPDWDDL